MDLGRLAAPGAMVGDVPTWDGARFKPAAPAGGGGGAPVFPVEQARLTGFATITTGGSVTFPTGPTSSLSRSHTTTDPNPDTLPTWLSDGGGDLALIASGLYQFYLTASVGSNPGNILASVSLNTAFYDVPLSGTSAYLVPSAFGGLAGSVGFPVLSTDAAGMTFSMTANAGTLSGSVGVSVDLTIVRLGDVTPTY